MEGRTCAPRAAGPGSAEGTRTGAADPGAAPLGSWGSQPGFRYSYIPSLPPSLPKPDSRYPPNPAASSYRFVELIQTTPAFSFGDTSSARLMFSDQRPAANP